MNGYIALNAHYCGTMGNILIFIVKPTATTTNIQKNGSMIMLNLDCANDITEIEEGEEMLKCAKHGYIRECPCKCEEYKSVTEYANEKYANA